MSRPVRAFRPGSPTGTEQAGRKARPFCPGPATNRDEWVSTWVLRSELGVPPFVPVRISTRDRRVPAGAGFWAVSLPRQGILFFSFFYLFLDFEIVLVYFYGTTYIYRTRSCI